MGFGYNMVRVSILEIFVAHVKKKNFDIFSTRYWTMETSYEKHNEHLFYFR